MSYMELKNKTRVPEFILLGLSEDTEVQPLLFALFLMMYLVTLIGTLLIILATISDADLHMPMYFFLAKLFFADISFTSTTVSKMLVKIKTQTKTISYGNCLTQMFICTVFGELDSLFLTVIAYDHYVAICHPLTYMVIMNPRLCGLLLLVSWILSVLNSLLHSLMVLQLTFCSGLEIHHFLCEFTQVTLLACSDTFLNDIVMYFATGILGGIPFTGIFFSYSKIACSILRISHGGKYKAFSTCGSHLSVVSLFYGTLFAAYLSSAATQNTRSSTILSVMFTVVTPMLNPFIYSLRNKDIKDALKIISCKTDAMYKDSSSSSSEIYSSLTDVKCCEMKIKLLLSV